MIVCAAPPNGGLAYEKPQSALRPFVRFFSGTFGSGGAGGPLGPPAGVLGAEPLGEGGSGGPAKRGRSEGGDFPPFYFSCLSSVQLR
jgi:hypothetical protein